MSLDYDTYEPTPSELARFRHRQEQVARWVEDEDSIAERDELYSPSHPPSGLPDGYGPDDASDAGSSHSNPPIMFLQWPDGRMEERIPHQDLSVRASSSVHPRSRSFSSRGPPPHSTYTPSPFRPATAYGHRSGHGPGGRDIALTIPNGPNDWVHGNGAGPVSAPPLGGVYSRALLDTPERPPEDIRILPTTGTPAPRAPPSSSSHGHGRVRSSSVPRPPGPPATITVLPPVPGHPVLDQYGVPTRMSYSQSAPEPRGGKYSVHTHSPLAQHYHHPLVGGVPMPVSNMYVPHAAPMHARSSVSSGSSGKTYYLPAAQHPISHAYYPGGSPTSTKVGSPTSAKSSHHRHGHSHHIHRSTTPGPARPTTPGGTKKPLLQRIFGLGIFGNGNGNQNASRSSSSSDSVHRSLRRRHSMGEGL